MRRGARYESRIWLSSDYTNRPAIMKITRIMHDRIYYRPDYGHHDDGTEWLGSAAWIPNTPQAIQKYLGRPL